MRKGTSINPYPKGHQKPWGVPQPGESVRFRDFRSLLNTCFWGE